MILNEKLVAPDRECLNSIFEELSDWEHQLKHLDEDLLEILEGPDYE